MVFIGGGGGKINPPLTYPGFQVRQQGKGQDFINLTKC